MSGRTAEEWGRVAVALPGWRWWFEYGPSGATRKCEIPISEWQIDSEGDLITAGRCTPDPDDPATAGCLLALLGGGWTVQMIQAKYGAHGPGVVVTMGPAWRARYETGTGKHFYTGTTLGRACIAAARSLGQWPGGDL